MDQKLPVAAFRGEILEKVAANSAVIITAETGAGKSTRVPQYLLDAGYDIVVTQPRRLAARTVAQRVADERGEELGGVVGYRTAQDRKDSAATRCLFVTDGLALVRELMGAGRHQVLVLDEVHEWNLNIETLVAWALRQIKAGAPFKVVLMSATLEAERLAGFFGGAPVISVPGRTFPVEVRAKGASLVEDVAALAKAGRNVLVFQPGKREIEETISSVRMKLGEVAANVLPLHGELTAEEQAQCFRSSGVPKVVVATNVAQTSVTIPDIDAVVDAGTERRIELVDGVEGLYLKAISRADSAQRKGRAGRTKPGVYIDHCASQDRLEFPKAEILRTRLDQTVLRLAEAGFDMEELEFFHQPAKDEIHDAKRALKALGCMDSDGRVTKIGRAVAKMPISVQFARMVVEADSRGVLDDVLTAAAILESGEITIRPKDRYEPPAWRKLAGGEAGSDVMAQIAVFKAASAMKKEQFGENGVHTKAFYKAKEVRRHLADALRGKVRSSGSSGDRTEILKSVVAGMVDHVYQNGGGRWINGDRTERELGRESVVKGGAWLVGLPFDLQIQTRRGPAVLSLIRMATVVDPAWLAEIAPQLVEVKTGLSPAYDAAKDVLTSVTQTFFNGAKTSEKRVEDPQHEKAAEVFAQWVAARTLGY